MRITAPEYLILLGIGVLNVWAALILASVRSRAKDQPMPLVTIEHPSLEIPQRTSNGQRA